MTICDIVDILIRKASFDSPVTADKICSFFDKSETEDVLRLLKENTGKKLPLGAAIRERNGGYYADLPFSETDIVILRTALLGLPYCEWKQTSAISERLNALLPEHMREQADNFQTGSEEYSGTFYENLGALIKALYPAPVADGRCVIKKVSFEYSEYNEYAELVPYRGEKKLRTVNPIKIICMNNYFYLAAYFFDKAKNDTAFRNYRIDRMTNVTATDEDADDFENMMKPERKNTLALKRMIDKERGEAHEAGRLYFEPKADISMLDSSQRIDDHGFNVGEYIKRSKWMFTDEGYHSAAIKVMKVFMNTVVDTFGFDFDVIDRDENTVSLRIYNVSRSSLINLALQFPEQAQVLYTDDGDKGILGLIAENIAKLSKKYIGEK